VSLPEPEQAVPPPSQAPVATSKMRSIIGGLVRFRATP